MEGCYHCNKRAPYLEQCHYCNQRYCTTHYLAEKHKCPQVMAFSADTYKGKQDIQEAKFAVNCKNCGATSPFTTIDNINKIRLDHIHKHQCPSHLVQLVHDKNEKNIAFNANSINHYPTDTAHHWMYGSLEEAKQILRSHFTQSKKDQNIKTLREIKIKISIQDDTSTYSFIEGGFPEYEIAVSRELKKSSETTYLSVMVLFIHHLLHILYNNWPESQVSEETKKVLANHKESYRILHILNNNPTVKKICNRNTSIQI